MIHFGEFHNINNELITVSFDSRDEPKDIWLDNIAVSSTEFLNEVKDHYYYEFNISTGVIRITPTTLSYKLSIIRLFKGRPISITKYSGGQCRVVISNLRKNKALMPAVFLNVNQTFSYTPTEDCYLLVNLSTTSGVPYVGAKVNRQDAKEVIFSEDPVTISTKSDGIFSPLKLSSATVRLMTNEIYYELFSSNATNIEVNINNYDTKEKLFRGFVTPAIYSQGYTSPYEELEVECISIISAMEHVKRKISQENVVTWYSVIKEILSPYYDGFYIQQTYEVDQSVYILDTLCIKENNFVVEDGTMSQKDILEKFCTSLGFSLVEVHGEIYFVDYARLGYEETPFTAYKFSDDEPQDILIGTVAFISSDAANETPFTSDSQKLSFDDVYGKVVIKDEEKEEKYEDVLNFEEDNLICLHPNVPYITYSSYDPNYYTDLIGVVQDTHNTVYRFYILKDTSLYYYSSNFNAQNLTYGIGSTPNAISINTIQGLKNATTEEQAKSLIETWIRTNACCLVVKHYHYKNQALKENEREIKWDTCLFFSYGLKNVRFNYNANYDANLSACLKNHYRSFKEKKFIETTKSYSFIKDNYLDLYGQCYFMNYVMSYGRQDMLNTEANAFNSDNVKKYTFEQTRDNFVIEHWGSTAVWLEIYTTLMSIGLNKSGTTNWFRFPYTYSQFTEFMYMAGNKDPNDLAYNSAKDFLYKWHSPFNNVKYTYNILNTKGHVIKLDDSYDSTLVFSAPLPYDGCNNAVANFAMVKDVDINIRKKYPIEIAMLGEIDSKEKEYVAKTNYINSDELNIDIPYPCQSEDRPILENALLSNYGGVFKTVSHVTFHTIDRPIEEILLDGYIRHYSTPKKVFECTVRGDSDINQLNTILYNKLSGDYIVDEIDYNVIDNNKTIKLIEK